MRALRPRACWRARGSDQYDQLVILITFSRLVDTERHRAREYLDRLLSVPWTARAEAPLDLARAHAVLDAGHAGHEAVKQRLLDQLAVRVSNPGAGFPAICVSGPPGVGKSALARLVAAALGRPCAWLSCAGLDSAAVHGVRAAAPGRIVEELRRAGVRNPVFVLDEVDRLDAAGGAAAALLDALDPDPPPPSATVISTSRSSCPRRSS